MGRARVRDSGGRLAPEEHSPLREPCLKEERSRLARLVEEYEEPEGATLVGQGDYGYELIVIQDGTVEVIRESEQIDTMGPGDFFGEAALRSGTLRNASILATSSVEVLALSAHNIKLARDQTPALAEQIDLAASERQARSARLDR